MNTLHRNMIILGLALGLSACGGDELSSRAQQAQSTVQPTQVVPSDSPEHDLPDAREQATADLSIQSIQDIRAAAARVQDARPRFYAAILAMEPRRTRNDLLRFTEVEMHDADAAPILALRLLDEPNTLKLERLALVDAIARTMGDFGPYLNVLMPAELDPEVRAGLVYQLARASEPSARIGLELALRDADALVREAAFRSLASQPKVQGELLSESIVAGLDESDDAVRTAAAFAARVRGESLALDRLVSLAQSDSSDARIQALRAIESIDAGRLAELDLAALAQDSDPRVARFATKTRATR